MDKDIRVFYVEATSFPEGVLDAHQDLHEHVPFSEDRCYFGISRLEKGTIKYKAAAEELYAGEGAEFGFKTIDLKKGEYVCRIVSDFREKIPEIGSAFQQLLSTPGIDPQGYCVEWYLTGREDVRCMVRLQD